MPSNKKGFTLLELIVTLTILVIVLGAVYMMIVSTINATQSQRNYAQTQPSVRTLLSVSEQAVRRSSQDMTIQVEGDCYIWNRNTGDDIRFCTLENHRVSYNDSVFFDYIDSFSINQNNQEITIHVKGVYGNDTEVSKTTSLRP